MTVATHQDILRLFPGISDHGAIEILDMKATLGDLEAAAAVLARDDEGLVEAQEPRGRRVQQILVILDQAGIQHSSTDRDR